MTGKKLISGILALVMSLSLIYTSALAATGDAPVVTKAEFDGVGTVTYSVENLDNTKIYVAAVMKLTEPTATVNTTSIIRKASVTNGKIAVDASQVAEVTAGGSEYGVALMQQGSSAVIASLSFGAVATVTVSFAAGEGATGTMESVQAPLGQDYTLPAPTFTAPEGYTFRAWTVDGDNKLYQAGDTYAVTGAVTFTANWVKQSALPGFDKDAATVADGVATVTVKNADVEGYNLIVSFGNNAKNVVMALSSPISSKSAEQTMKVYLPDGADKAELYIVEGDVDPNNFMELNAAQKDSINLLSIDK